VGIGDTDVVGSLVYAVSSTVVDDASSCTGVKVAGRELVGSGSVVIRLVYTEEGVASGSVQPTTMLSTKSR